MAFDAPALFTNIMASAAMKNAMKFTGDPREDPIRFLEEFDILCKVGELPELHRIYLFRSSLEGTAKEWLATLPVTLEYKELLQLFIRRFRTTDRNLMNILDVLRNQPRTGDRILPFLDKLRGVSISSASTTDHWITALALNAFPEELRRRALDRDTNTEMSWDLIYQLAASHDQIYTTGTAHSGAASQHGRSPGTSPCHSDHQSYCDSSTQSNTTRSQKYCVYHESDSHSTDSCFELKRLAEKRKERFQNRKSPTESRSNLNFIHLKGGSALPHCTVRIAECTTEALLDSEAGASFLKYSENIPKGLIKPCRIQAFGPDGKNLQIQGQINRLRFWIDNKRLRETFIVVKDLHQDCILGWPFLQKHLSHLWKVKDAVSLRSLNHIETDAAQLDPLIQRFHAIFTEEVSDPKPCPAGEHEIRTGDHVPIAVQGYRIPLHLVDSICGQLKKLLKLGIVRQSSSPWSAPLVPVGKHQALCRLPETQCSNGTRLVPASEDRRHPHCTIGIQNLLNSGRSIGLPPDSNKGVRQGEDRILISVGSARVDKDAIRAMPNAPSTFQRTLDSIFREEKLSFVKIYLDDIIIHSRSREEREHHITIVLEKLRAKYTSTRKSAVFSELKYTH